MAGLLGICIPEFEGDSEKRIGGDAVTPLLGWKNVFDSALDWSTPPVISIQALEIPSSYVPSLSPSVVGSTPLLFDPGWMTVLETVLCVVARSVGVVCFVILRGRRVAADTQVE